MSSEVTLNSIKNCDEDIPSVDNTEIKCSCYTPSDCIIFEEGNAYIGSPVNASVTRVIKDLINKIQIQSTRITKLEADVLALKTQV